MRLSLAPRQDACQHVASNRKGRMAVEPVSPRNQAVAATETVALVLDEDSPLPETTADVEDLARRLRGHINRLGVMAPKEAPALRRAQQLGSVGDPDGYMPSRVHLVRLAEAAHELVATVEAHGTGCVTRQRGRRWWTPPINLLRGIVLPVAFACLVLAASTPRT
ncbi:DUF6415 family natural product biosynthesis protein [Streptomyces tirandamycinicus]|uniref:DUF6415 family natural product biosynthesis protein n=1 Tax=Streptomyces tirandamycinicus TaxID=2174846 RepID=UPI0022719FA2|nr:DUF6415 family natural product biosynthesis protein [Streptomyces tirandamycinicus]MCY0979549.1 DUF6415 family natural product biosynthesis protein [Streptomyces tirandamycinicus]